MSDQIELLTRIAAALERLAPPLPRAVDFTVAEAFVWSSDPDRFEPVDEVNRVPLALLIGIDRAAEQLMSNTERFARGLARQ